ncbi:MAG: hypothetical protein JWO50_837 [Candidatus Kaiserbacteria bacterium]|nr:hypothetical protein [Candidatus Kaiserbacteria bacterium]
MYSRHEYGNIIWVDLESPARSDVERIIEEFDIHPSVAEELLVPSVKARAEYYGEYAYLVLHFPALRHSHKTREQEMDFIVGKNFLITTHYDLIDPLHKFSKLFDTQALLNDHQGSEHAGMIMLSMIKKLYKAVEHEVQVVRQNLHDIEDHIFSNHHVEMVSAISRSSRDLLNLRHTIEPHRDTLQSFELFAPQLFGQEFMLPLKTLTNEYYRVHNHIVRETESLHELRETNNSMLTTKQNETMRIFTILAFVTFPLTLIVDVVNIDSEYNPLLHHQYDFWYVLGILLVVACFMFVFFKVKKWL